MFTNEYFSDRVSARTRGRGVSQIQTAADRGSGESKITKNVRTSFMDGSIGVFL